MLNIARSVCLSSSRAPIQFWFNIFFWDGIIGRGRSNVFTIFVVCTQQFESYCDKTHILFSAQQMIMLS